MEGSIPRRNLGSWSCHYCICYWCFGAKSLDLFLIKLLEVAVLNKDSSFWLDRYGIEPSFGRSIIKPIDCAQSKFANDFLLFHLNKNSVLDYNSIRRWMFQKKRGMEIGKSRIRVEEKVSKNSAQYYISHRDLKSKNVLGFVGVTH